MIINPVSRALPVLLAVALASSSLPALADTPESAEFVRGGMYDGSSPERITRFMQQLGYQVELGKDGYGDPMIFGRLSSTDYSIQFYECDNGELCNSIQFIVEVEPPGGLTLRQINAANQQWRYVRVSVAGAILRIQMDINLDGGVTATNFEDTLHNWSAFIKRFEQEFRPDIVGNSGHPRHNDG